MAKLQRIKEKLLPKKLRVGICDYTIMEVPDLKDEKGNELYGRHSQNRLTIEIGSLNPTPYITLDTLIHEILHSIYNQYALREKGEPEERVVSVIATGMVSVLRDNPELVKYIMEVCKSK